jgi:hypothetical protein
MHKPTIALSITKWAYVEEKKCCSGNCILKLIQKFTFDKVVCAIHLARSDVYHTNANHAHEELRELLKFGRCAENEGVMAYFDHKNVFESDASRIKVSNFQHFYELHTYFACKDFLCFVLYVTSLGLSHIIYVSL